MSLPRLLLPFLLAAACTDTGDDTGSSVLPDVVGGYQFFLDGVSSSNLCEEENHYVTDWLRGTLQITGESSDDVTFTFSDGISFPGGVDGSWSYWFGGEATWEEAYLDVSHHGTFGSDDGRRIFSGVFEVTVDDDEFTTNNCIIEVAISGTRIAD
jgi:hypothetical protein